MVNYNINKLKLISDNSWNISKDLTLYKLNGTYMLYNKQYKNDIKFYKYIETISYKFFICYDDKDRECVDIYNMECELIYSGKYSNIYNDIFWESIYKYKGDYLKDKKPRRGKDIQKSDISISIKRNKYGVLISLKGLYIENRAIRKYRNISSNYYSFTEGKWLSSDTSMQHLENRDDYTIINSKSNTVKFIRKIHLEIDTMIKFNKDISQVILKAGKIVGILNEYCCIKKIWDIGDKIVVVATKYSKVQIFIIKNLRAYLIKSIREFEGGRELSSNITAEFISNSNNLYYKPMKYTILDNIIIDDKDKCIRVRFRQHTEHYKEETDKKGSRYLTYIVKDVRVLEYRLDYNTYKISKQIIEYE